MVDDIPNKQPIVFLSADHLIENPKKFNIKIKKNTKKLTDNNIFIFGIKPNTASDQFGYFTTSKLKKSINKVIKFIEKPKLTKAKQIIKKGGYWNSGMFLIRKDSVINNFKRYQKKMFFYTSQAFKKAKINKNIIYLNKKIFNRNLSKSFDYAILEKTKNIRAIKLDIIWSDLGSWKEILLMFNKNKKKFYKQNNIFTRPWGSYTNLYKGNNFLIKELFIKPKGILSLQKHFHRSEHWVVTQGNPKIILNKRFYFKKKNETIFIPKGAIHRIQNPDKKIVKVMEVQLGSILKESDIVRLQDVYGRIS